MVFCERRGLNKKGISEEKKLWLSMQAPPTDPLYDASHPDESNKYPAYTTVDVKRNPNDFPVPEENEDGTQPLVRPSQKNNPRMNVFRDIAFNPLPNTKSRGFFFNFFFFIQILQ